MKWTTFQTILVAGLISASCCAGQTIEIPAGWVKIQNEVPQDKDFSCANHSQNEWRVAIHAPELEISDSARSKPANPVFPPRFVRTREMAGRASVLQTAKGWLIGFDGGEFGGGLWWANVDGSKAAQLSSENVQVMISRAKEILVLTGLAHLGMDEGTIYSYKDSAGRSGTLTRISSLGAQPGAAVLRDDGTLLIATQRRILELTSSNQLKTIYENNNLSLLYPNSIVVDQTGAVFVGMRFYVLRLQRGSGELYDATWLVRSDCTNAKVESYHCVCTGDAAK